MNKNKIIQTLLEIDEEVELMLGIRDPKPRIIIVGGAAFVLRDSTNRPATHDIDVYEADRVLADILSHYPTVNGSVAAYADHIPYNYEDRLAPLEIGSRAVDFLTPSNEDLAVMKLYADRPTDGIDVKEAIRRGLIDLNALERLVYDADEAKASAISPRRYDEMVYSYEKMRREVDSELNL